jgi:hypothetical protein
MAIFGTRYKRVLTFPKASECSQPALQAVDVSKDIKDMEWPFYASL